MSCARRRREIGYLRERDEENEFKKCLCEIAKRLGAVPKTNPFTSMRMHKTID
jgi:hypothetical protein